MRNRLLILGLCATVTAFALALPAPRVSQAQGDMLTCDSTLVLMLYIAEHDYGFKSMMDVSTLEKGQFKPWFEAMMADSMMEATSDAMMGTPESMMMATQDAMMTMLQPGNVQDEPEGCTTLRAEIEAFLYNTISAKMMMQ
ncbi:MAG: hypothetical protein IT323_12295 [Anaerolineae bacterium]|nr:hypothetical protein [Anaerolineae bacterium]